MDGWMDVLTGLSGLMRTLVSRKKSAPEGSYTKRLFNDPLLLKAKLLEEVCSHFTFSCGTPPPPPPPPPPVFCCSSSHVSCGGQATELAEAEDKDHVANEAADLFYFALTACAKAGVTLSDIEEVLGAALGCPCAWFVCWLVGWFIAHDFRLGIDRIGWRVTPQTLVLSRW